MINIIDKEKCCGCSACVQRCPKNCISLMSDEEGFLYPRVDIDACINCGLCEKTCPVLCQSDSHHPLEVFSAKNNNVEQQLNSSSGGIFILLAEQTIRMGGVVFGARFDNNWGVEHACAKTMDELRELMGSKYVQSKIGNTYKEAEFYLKQGVNVLFSGVPCQIAGLRKYLNKEYENLLAIDIVCHGVPSPIVWRQYVDNINNSAIGHINFRSKQLDGFNWVGYGLVIKDKNGKKLVSEKCTKNLYLSGFRNNLFLRPSCHSCPLKEDKNLSDITLGDCWGIEKSDAIYDNRGISLIVARSEKGLNALQELNITVQERSYDFVLAHNSALVKSTPINPNRKDFWESFSNNGISCIRQFVILEPSLYVKIIRTIKRILTLLSGENLRLTN